MFAFTHKLDHCTTLEAELWVIYHGMSLAWGCGFRNILVESDCAESISLLSDIALSLHSDTHLVQGVKDIAYGPYNLVWSLVLCEANTMAYTLARRDALNSELCKIFNFCPHFLQSMLELVCGGSVQSL